MAETIYDVAIIGSGPAGYTAAIRAGEYGLKTCLIEKDDLLGGTYIRAGPVEAGADVVNYDTRALLRQQQRNRAPDAAPRPSDDRNFTFDDGGHGMDLRTAANAVASEPSDVEF